MLRFACSHCHRVFAVANKHSGKKGTCPKCGHTLIVPEKSTILEMHCASCGRKIRVPDSSAGKQGKCPTCKSPVVVPSLNRRPDVADETVPDTREESAVPWQAPKRVDRQRIILISVVAVVLVMVLTSLLVLGTLRSRSAQAGAAAQGLTLPELDRIQAFAQRYLGLLENGELEAANQLHSPGFGPRGHGSFIGEFSRLLSRFQTIERDCTQACREPNPEGDCFFLWYEFRFDRREQALILSVIQIGQTLAIDGVVLLEPSGFSISAGPKSREALRAAAKAATERSRIAERLGKIVFVMLVCAAFLVKYYFRRRCPACGKRWGLRRTTWFYLLWFPDDGMYEYRCKACGHTEWQYRGHS